MCTSYETYVDSHCHLDKSFKGYSVLALRNYLSFEVVEVDLEFVVSNFVFPYVCGTIPHLPRSSLVYCTINVESHNVDYRVSKVKGVNLWVSERWFKILPVVPL